MTEQRTASAVQISARDIKSLIAIMNDECRLRPDAIGGAWNVLAWYIRQLEEKNAIAVEALEDIQNVKHSDEAMFEVKGHAAGALNRISSLKSQ